MYRNAVRTFTPFLVSFVNSIMPSRMNKSIDPRQQNVSGQVYARRTMVSDPDIGAFWHNGTDSIFATPAQQRYRSKSLIENTWFWFQLFHN